MEKLDLISNRGLAYVLYRNPIRHSGTLTEGIVKDILTKSPTHPHGIKVRLVSGAVGRVKEILCDNP